MTRPPLVTRLGATLVVEGGAVTRGDLGARQIVRDLKKDGALCLQSFFDRRSVEKMRGEAVGLLDGQERLKVKPENLKQGCPALFEALSSDLFKEIVLGYNGKCEFLFNAVVEHATKPGKKITDIHFDMRRSLKFMIYLSDIDKSSAAFRYCLGSHRDNQKLRNRFLLMGGSLQKLPNVAGPNENHVLTDMEGPQGTLIVFDTEGFHSAGTLQEGKERLLIRGRTMLYGWFDNDVLRLATRLSPLRLFAPSLAPEGRGSTGGSGLAKDEMRPG